MAHLSIVPKSEESPLLTEEEYRQYKEEREAVASGSGGGNKKKDAHSDANWLVSYADMMTLLVGFFVMLLSFSKIDADQFEKIKRATTEVFGGEYVLPFEQLSNKLKEVIKEQNLSDQVVFTENDQGITLRFRGALFFDSGSSDLRPQAKNLLDKLVPVLIQEAKDFGVVIEGHTDNVPLGILGQALFPSNWELSGVRACTVLRLFEERGFNRQHLKAIGWGDTRPIVPNEDGKGNFLQDNQAQNRRVVIKILKYFEENGSPS